MNTAKLNPNNSISTELISSLIKRITIPDCQRLLDNTHVHNIYESFINTIKQDIEPKILSTIALAIEPDGTTYIIDGNHRLHAYQKLLKDGYDLNVYVQTIKSQSHAETERLFEYFNNSLPVSKLPEGTKRSKINKILTQIYHEYDKYTGSKKASPKPIFTDTVSGITNRPRISRVKFEEAIAKIIELGINPDEIAPRIKEYNRELSHKCWTFFKITTSDSQRKINRFLETADSYDCRLGLKFLERDNYNQLYKIFGLDSEQTLIRTKQRIPQALKVKVWNKYCGSNVRKSSCPCCRETIDITSFHCAHDIAESHGGELTLDNLYPCCASCNLSMGKSNFEEWCKKLDNL